MMSQSEIQDVIIDALAKEAGSDLAGLRRQLEEAGEQLPIDSLLAAEVLVEVEQRCGVSLPATAENAKNLTSVTTFAAAVHQLLVSAPVAETA